MNRKIEHGDPKQPHPMDPVRLAATAYHALIDRAFVIQQRMVMREATKAMFGPDAIPLVPAFRSGRDVLTCSEAHMRREEEHDRESLEEIMAQIKEMEPIFKGHAEENTRRFVQEMMRRFEEETKRD